MSVRGPPEVHEKLVYIADDDPAMRLIAHEVLVAEGFAVETFVGAAALIAACAARPPNLIVMDVEMPGLNGFHACTELRADPITAQLPIVMVTGHDDTLSINNAYQAGATDFISKPVNWSLFGHRLRYVMRAARSHLALMARENENRALLDAIPDAILVVHEDGRVLRALHGTRGRDDVLVSNIETRLSSDPANLESVQLLATLRHVIDEGSINTVEIASTQDGVSQTFELRCTRLNADEALVIARDITERKAAEVRIHRLAYFDALTGLPNRQYFVEEMDRVLIGAAARSSGAAALYLDLDRFKRINDTFGHSIGDGLLQAAAGRITEVCNGSDRRCFVARLGGDEFTILVSDISNVEQLRDLVAAIDAAFTRPMSVSGHDFVITPSIGVAIYPEHATDGEALLKNADTAMYFAKTQGRNECAIYVSSMNARAYDALEIENALRAAIDRDELFVAYQPKLRASDSRLIGAEALARWRHAVRGEIAAAEFIPIAEETGLIVDIGRAVVRQVVRQLSVWRSNGLDLVPVAVNLSALQFGRHEVVAEVRALLDAYQIPGELLEFEITESVLLQATPSVNKTIRDLRAMGCRISIDDFGTGYSSLSYLQNLQIDALKIDKSFVNGLPVQPTAAAICGAVVALAKGLNLEVIAEGVETESQLQHLRKLGCDTVQGFLTGKPTSSTDFSRRLTTSRRIATRAVI